MTVPHILVLGGNARILAKASALGMHITNVEKPSRFDPETTRYCAQTHLFDYQDIELVTELTRTLHSLAPISRIVTQTEIGQTIAGHLNTTLGLPGNTAETTWTLHDKLALRALLNDKGIGPVPAARLTARQDLDAFVAEHGPAIVKPVMGSGSLGVRKVRSAREVTDVWEWSTAYGEGEFMVEKLLRGDEVSVETFTVDGEHTVIAITGKDTGHGVIERGHVVPAPLSTADAVAAASFTRHVLDAVGIVDGVAHTELMLTEHGPHVIESHSRCGGDRISKLVELATGLDLEALPFHRAAREHFTVPVPTEHRAAAIRFLDATPGQVTEVLGTEAARTAQDVVELRVNVTTGDVVRPLRWSEDRCGYVVVHADTSAEAVHRATSVARSIVIRTTALDHPPELTMRDILTEADEKLTPFS